MKKFYADPMMVVKSFETENIVTTASGNQGNSTALTADELAQTGYTVKSVKLAELNITF